MRSILYFLVMSHSQNAGRTLRRSAGEECLQTFKQLRKHHFDKHMNKHWPFTTGKMSLIYCQLHHCDAGFFTKEQQFVASSLFHHVLALWIPSTFQALSLPPCLSFEPFPFSKLRL